MLNFLNTIFISMTCNKLLLIFANVVNYINNFLNYLFLSFWDNFNNVFLMH